MNSIGRSLRQHLLLAALALMLIPAALAEVTATVDRSNIALGDTLRLTITATDGENVKEADLRPLLADFEILQRSSSSNYSLINGRGSRTEQLLLDISPRREGQLRIPPMRVGKGATPRIEVTVANAPDVQTGGQTIIFDAELDRDSTYVQGQVILTLRLQQAVNLDNRSISELELDGAFIHKLEQKSFQRNIDGRQWLVHEVRYALFPVQSGTLDIPAQVFTARVPTGRRTLFDVNGPGRLVKRNSEPLSVQVLPRPAEFSSQHWLAARQLSLAESWSTDPEQLRVGESVTRTIRIQGEGVQGAQLPPIDFVPVDGLKFYPDQPDISQQEVSTGLLGTRMDSVAIVPTRPGVLEIPEVRIPWWDSQTGQMRQATLPARRITVVPAADSVIEAAAPVATPAVAGSDAVATVPVDNKNALPWQVLSAVNGVGWLLTLLWLWRRQRRGQEQPTEAAVRTMPSRKTALRLLLKQCKDNNPSLARQALIDWARTALDAPTISSLDELAGRLNSDALSAQLQALEAALYGAGEQGWSGQQLADCVTQLDRQLAGQRDAAEEETLSLYPNAA